MRSPAGRQLFAPFGASASSSQNRPAADEPSGLADDDLDSVLLALMKRDPAFEQMDEQTFKNAIDHEAAQFMSLGVGGCAQYADQVKRALIFAAPTKQMQDMVVATTDSFALRDMWLQVLEDYAPRFTELVAKYRPTRVTTPSFVESVKAAVKRKANPLGAESASVSPPIGRQRLGYVTPSPSHDQKSKAQRKLWTSGAAATPVGISTPTKTPTPDGAIPPQGKTPEVAPLPPLPLNQHDLDHVDALRRAGTELSKISERTQDWIAGVFQTDPAHLHRCFKGLACAQVPLWETIPQLTVSPRTQVKARLTQTFAGLLGS